MSASSSRHGKLFGRPLRRVWYAPIAVVATLLVAGTAAASTAVILHGRGDLVSRPLSEGIEVIGAQLNPILIPGGTSDVVVSVRNRSGLTLVADRVTLQIPLRDARPAGCTAEVSGPLMARAGVALTGEQRILLGPRETAQITVPSALKLATGAREGCGFRVVVDVQATQTRPAPSPSRVTPPPPTTPTMSPTPTTSPTTLSPPDGEPTPTPSASAEG